MNMNFRMCLVTSVERSHMSLEIIPNTETFSFNLFLNPRFLLWSQTFGCLCVCVYKRQQPEVIQSAQRREGGSPAFGGL